MKIKIFVDEVEVTALRVGKKEAAGILNCTVHEFDEKFMRPGLIQADQLSNDFNPLFWVQDLLLIYRREKRKKEPAVQKKTASNKDHEVSNFIDSLPILVGRRKWLLTPKMQEVLNFVQQGYTSRQIAEIKGLTIAGVQSMRAKIRTRLKMIKEAEQREKEK